MAANDNKPNIITVRPATPGENSRNLTVRRATPGDYPAVMKIGFEDVGDFDYLAWFFWIALHTKGFVPCVAALDGQVIFYSVMYVDPSGRTYSKMAGRMSKQWTHTGLYSDIKPALNIILEESYPNVEHEIHAAFKTSYYDDNLDNLVNVRKTFVLERELYLLQFKIGKEKIQALNFAISRMRTGPFPVIERLAPSQVMSLILTTDDIETILRRHGEYFIFGYPWMPLKVSKENIKLAASLSCMLVTRHASGQMAAVSFQSCYPCLQGIRIDFSFFGEDSTHYLAHVRKQLQRALAATRAEQYNIMLPIPFGLDVVWIENFLQSYLGPRHVPKGDYRNQIILSKLHSKM